MHPLHGIKFNQIGHNSDLGEIPEVVLDNAECVPIEINGKYYWLVTGADNCGAMTEDSKDQGRGVLAGVEALIDTEVHTLKELFQYNV